MHCQGKIRAVRKQPQNEAFKVSLVSVADVKQFFKIIRFSPFSVYAQCYSAPTISVHFYAALLC